MIKNNADKIADSLIFPIMHNVNHAIELHLKAIEFSLNIQLGNGLIFTGNHDILQLLDTVLARITELSSKKESNAFKGLTQVLRDYINEVYDKVDNAAKNKKLEFSRYPITSNKRDMHFYIKATENVEIDLENYILIIKEIRQTLGQMLDQFLYDG